MDDLYCILYNGFMLSVCRYKSGMRYAILTIVAVSILILASWATGLVGFHYPKVIQDEPLHQPLRVVRVEGTNLFLQNGDIIALYGLDASQINNMLSQTAFEIDVKNQNGDLVIFARQNGWVCGTPWAQPLRVPLFEDTVYKNRRQLIAMGTYIQTTRPTDTQVGPGLDLRQ